MDSMLNKYMHFESERKEITAARLAYLDCSASCCDEAFWKESLVEATRDQNLPSERTALGSVVIPLLKAKTSGSVDFVRQGSSGQMWVKKEGLALGSEVMQMVG